jgi:hypothetical protein
MNREVNADGAKFFVFMFPGYGYYHGNKSDYYATKRFFAEQLANLELLDLTLSWTRAANLVTRK